MDVWCTSQSLNACSMCQGESFESALAIGSAGPVVMRVFVKGNAGAFFSEREKIVASLAEDLDVPLLPTSWKVWLCRKVVDVLAELLEAAREPKLIDSAGSPHAALAASTRANSSCAPARSRASSACCYSLLRTFATTVRRAPPCRPCAASSLA